MSYQHVPFGSALNLELLLPDGNTGKYPQAHVYDSAGSEVAGSPFNLTHSANALYRNTAYTPSAVGRYSAVYITYNDSGYSVESTKHGRAKEHFEVDSRIAEVTAIKAKTDQLTFTGSNVNADAQVNSDKTGYALTVAEKDDIVDRTWDEDRVDHTAVGSFGEANQGVVSTTRANNLDNLDVTVSSRESETDAASRFATTDGKNTAIKAKTDQLLFTGGNVHADAKVVSDKTGYQTTSGDKNLIADAVWDEDRGDHTAVDSFGEANQGVVSTARANNLDNLDATVSSRESETDAASRDSAVNTKLDTIQTQTDKMNFTGGNIDAQVKVNEDKTDYTLNTATKDSIVDLVWNEPRSGHTAIGSFGESNQGVLSDTRATNLDNLDVTVSSRESDSDALSRHNATQVDLTSIEDKVNIIDTVVDAVKVVTDKFTFTGSYVNAQTKVNEDKTDYTIADVDKDILVDKVWNEYLSGHLVAGTSGKALYDAQQNVTASAISVAVWDALTDDHEAAGSFGFLAQNTYERVNQVHSEIQNPVYGLSALETKVVSGTATIVAEVNANETKIDAIIPQVISSANAVIAEVDQNEVKIDTLTANLVVAQAEIISEINTNELKIDSLSSQVGTIQNNTTSRFAVPTRLLKPDSGSKGYEFHLRLYDAQGEAEAPDSAPTIRIRRLDLGIDIVSGVAMTYLGSTGAYSYTYTVDPATPETHLLVEATVVENGLTRLVPAVTEVTEFQSDLDNIQTQLTLIDGKVTSTQSVVNNPTYGLSALKTGQTNIIAEVDQNELKINQVKARTDLIPNDPATEGSIAGVNATVLTRAAIADINASLAATESAIRGIDNRDLTSVYDVFDVSGLLESNDPRLDYLDAPITSRSTLVASDVWSYATRTITDFVLPSADIDKIWDYATGALTTVGSIGKLLADNVDVTISSRATAAQVTAELTGVAQQSTLNNVALLVEQKNNTNAAKIDSVKTVVDTIKVYTDRIPLTPASETTVVNEHNTTQLALADIESKVDGIKAKTDNLPVDPASEGSVAAIPTDPVLSSDTRLGYLDASVSSRSTLDVSDLSTLAEKSDIQDLGDALLPEISSIDAKVDSVGIIVSNIQAVTDNLPVDTASETQATANKDAILSAIAGLPVPGGTTPAEVWSYATRELTSDPNIYKADTANLATKTDVENERVDHYENQMSTVYNTITGNHELMAWAEKNGQRVAGTNCTVTVKDSGGATIWTGTEASPNADGIFVFSEATSSFQVFNNYYVVITIAVDGTPKTSQKTFFTVG